MTIEKFPTTKISGEFVMGIPIASRLNDDIYSSPNVVLDSRVRNIKSDVKKCVLCECKGVYLNKFPMD